MKKGFFNTTFTTFVLLSALKLALPCSNLAEVRDLVRIEDCYDGDTCRATSGERIRLACIDAPELRGNPADQDRAVAARDQLRMIVVGKTVDLRRITMDRYGRTVGELFLDGMNVQQLMVVGGYAVIHARYAHQCLWSHGQVRHDGW